MAKTKKFDTKFLRDKLDLPWSALEDVICDQDRWSTHHDIIFEYEGKFYSGWYSVGSTEMQDEGPWEYEEFVEFDEVEKKKVLVEKWVAVEEDD